MKEVGGGRGGGWENISTRASLHGLGGSTGGPAQRASGRVVLLLLCPVCKRGGCSVQGERRERGETANPGPLPRQIPALPPPSSFLPVCQHPPPQTAASTSPAPQGRGCPRWGRVPGRPWGSPGVREGRADLWLRLRSCLGRLWSPPPPWASERGKGCLNSPRLRAEAPHGPRGTQARWSRGQGRGLQPRGQLRRVLAALTSLLAPAPAQALW